MTYTEFKLWLVFFFRMIFGGGAIRYVRRTIAMRNIVDCGGVVKTDDGMIEHIHSRKSDWYDATTGRMDPHLYLLLLPGDNDKLLGFYRRKKGEHAILSNTDGQDLAFR